MSNGSERIIPGDVTGPRWVGGVNAPAPGGGDYEALVRELVRYGIGSGMGYPKGAARGALEIVENSAWMLQRIAEHARKEALLLKIAQEANDDCKALIAERAALRAQLDTARKEALREAIGAVSTAIPRGVEERSDAMNAIWALTEGVSDGQQ